MPPAGPVVRSEFVTGANVLHLANTTSDFNNDALFQSATGVEIGLASRSV